MISTLISLSEKSSHHMLNGSTRGLSTGALVEQVQLKGDRLQYKLLIGEGADHDVSHWFFSDDFLCTGGFWFVSYVSFLGILTKRTEFSGWHAGECIIPKPFPV